MTTLPDSQTISGPSVVVESSAWLDIRVLSFRRSCIDKTKQINFVGNILKNRLRLKRIAINVHDAVEWNFGHDPHYDWFDKMLNERNALSEIVKTTDAEWWNEYDKVENDRGIKSLMVFMVPKLSNA